MQTPSLDQSPIFIVQSRLGLGLLFVADLALFGLLIWLLSTGAVGVTAVDSARVITLMFGIIGLALGVIMLRLAKLQITQDGTWSGAWTLKAQAVVDLLNAGLERWGPRRPG